MVCALVLGPLVLGIALAEGSENPDDAVHWSASARPAITTAPGGAVTVDVSGEVGAGWHVYGPEQHSGGPTALRITVETADVATATGPLAGAAAEKVNDTHFGFVTQLFTHPFVVHLPVQIGAGVTAGKQLIPLSVRFQACSDRVCLLPRTVHLSVPVEVAAAG